jgi:hypothetical protein
MATVIVDLYLASRRVRAEIRTGNFNRLSDYLNSVPGTYLSGTSQFVSEVADNSTEGWTLSSQDMVALLSDIRFLDPIEEGPQVPPRPDLLRKRIQVPVELDVDAWRIAGVLHLMDRVPWTDYLVAARGHFVPLTRARAKLAGSESVIQSDLLLINASRISAIYAESG